MQWFCYFQKISSKMKWLQSWWANLACSNLQAKRSLLCMKRGASDPPTQSSCRSFRKYVLDLATLEFTQTNYNQFTPQSKRKEYMVLKGGYKYGRDIKELPLTDVPQLLICVKKPERIPTFQARRRRAAFKTQVCMATAWLSVSYLSCDALSSLERLTKQQISTRHIIAQIGRKNIIFYHSKASSDFEKTYCT